MSKSKTKPKTKKAAKTKATSKKPAKAKKIASAKPRATAKKKTVTRAKTARAAAGKRASAKAAAKPAQRPERRGPETLRLRRLSAGLTVGDIGRSVAWYRDVLGCIVEEEWHRDGKLAGAGMLAGTVRFFLGQDDWARGRNRQKGEGFRLHLGTAQDVDGVAARIKAAGGTLDSDPADMPWGARAFALTDPDGFKLTISSEE